MKGENAINFEQLIEAKELKEASISRVLHKYSIRIIFISILFLIYILLVCFFYTQSFFSAIIIPVFILLMLLLKTNSALKKQYITNSMNGKLLNWVINEKGISIKGEGYSYEISWNLLYGVSTNEKYVYIWKDSAHCIFFRKNYLTKEENELFEKFVIINKLTKL